MAVFVVEQRAGMAVPTAALIANMGLARTIVSASLSRVLLARLHESQVESGVPRGSFLILMLVLRRFGHPTMLHLQVHAEAGLAREGALTQRAGELPLLLVNPTMV